jgi:hypothetical protein
VMYIELLAIGKQVGMVRYTEHLQAKRLKL